MWNLRGCLDVLTGELLATLLDAFDAALRRAAEAGGNPTIHGVGPHILAMADVSTLVGADQEAQWTPKLRYAGEVTPPRCAGWRCKPS